jgi:DNA-binding NarL/FixJ family response regulator
VRLLVVGARGSRVATLGALLAPLGAVERVSRGADFGDRAAGHDAVVLVGVNELDSVSALSAHTAVVVVVATAAAAMDQALEALRSGARGALLDGEFTAADLTQCVARAVAGQCDVSPSITAALVGQLRAGPCWGPGPARLSPRERDVLGLVAAGADNAAIAHELALTTQTVRNYVSAIYRKLGVRHRHLAAARWRNDRSPMVEP